MIVVILRYLFSTVDVTANTIGASVCVYLLLAVLWSEIYSILEIVDPGSFKFPATSSEVPRFGRDDSADALYFSLVTMTTLGYGDIVPQTKPARTFASAQAVMGQIYLAVLVARLVGMHIAGSRRSADE